MLSANQESQENQYAFPYHHLVDYGDGIIQINRLWAWAINYLGRIEIICQTLKTIEFSNLLDIGCGDGKLLGVLSSQYGDKVFTGIDYSSQAIRLANSLCSSDCVGFREEDIYKSNKADKFDVVTLIEVAEHIPPDNLHKFICCVIEYMRPGGYLICTVPSINIPIPKKHYQHFSSQMMIDVVAKAGLEVIHSEMIDGTSFFFRMLKRLFFNKLFYVSSSRLHNYLFSIYKRDCLWNQGKKGNGVFVIAKKP